uniref:Cysteine-rich venom protein 6-like n=1 Tax=Diabrotica virgifera virgifera TaxID=50390 RepID=A0A6P7FF56_DIAVI
MHIISLTMKGIVCTVFVLLIVTLVFGQDDLCGPNSHYVQCKSCCPESTCQRFPSRFPRRCGICPAVCKAGCYCNLGFIRQSTNGPCIPIDKCF